MKKLYHPMITSIIIFERQSSNVICGGKVYHFRLKVRQRKMRVRVLREKDDFEEIWEGKEKEDFRVF